MGLGCHGVEAVVVQKMMLPKLLCHAEKQCQSLEFILRVRAGEKSGEGCKQQLSQSVLSSLKTVTIKTMQLTGIHIHSITLETPFHMCHLFHLPTLVAYTQLTVLLPQCSPSGHSLDLASIFALGGRFLLLYPPKLLDSMFGLVVTSTSCSSR